MDNELQKRDPLLPDAMEFFIKQNGASVSTLQRRLHIGYARAARLVGDCESLGFIGPNQGVSKPREIKMTAEKFKELFGIDIDDDGDENGEDRLIKKGLNGRAEKDEVLREYRALKDKLGKICKSAPELKKVSCSFSFTQYKFELATPGDVRSVSKSAADIAYELAVPSVRVIVPGNEKGGTVIVEVTRQNAATAPMPVLRDLEYRKSDGLKFFVGYNEDCEPQLCDLHYMPGILVGGAPGSGKTNLLRAMVLNIMYDRSPREVRFVLIDTKREAFTDFGDIPMLEYSRVLTRQEEADEALSHAIREMEVRHDMLSKARCTNIDSYNKSDNVMLGKETKLPHVVIMIDELADLILSPVGESVKAKITRLAQLSRAAGIHLVLATSHLSSDVISGIIKANFTNRVALRTENAVGSRMLIDMTDAELLREPGDMLFFPNELPGPVRCQAPIITEKDVAEGVKAVSQYERSPLWTLPNEQTEPEIEEPPTEEEVDSKCGPLAPYFAAQPDYDSATHTIGFCMEARYPDGVPLRVKLIYVKSRKKHYIAEDGHAREYIRNKLGEPKATQKMLNIIEGTNVELLNGKFAVHCDAPFDIDYAMYGILITVNRCLKETR